MNSKTFSAYQGLRRLGFEVSYVWKKRMWFDWPWIPHVKILSNFSGYFFTSSFMYLVTCGTIIKNLQNYCKSLDVFQFPSYVWKTRMWFEWPWILHVKILSNFSVYFFPSSFFLFSDLRDYYSKFAKLLQKFRCVWIPFIRVKNKNVVWVAMDSTCKNTFQLLGIFSSLFI
jgi:hypothetical protein